MKRLLFIILGLIVLVGCKQDTKTQDDTLTSSESEGQIEKQDDGLTLLKGDYVYHKGAAVLQTNTEIYGVLPTFKFEELNKKVDAFKSLSTDMVQIEIRGKITNKKHDIILWENKVEVMEILKVTPATKAENNIIKIGS